jgi:hypothetical protein
LALQALALPPSQCASEGRVDLPAPFGIGEDTIELVRDRVVAHGQQERDQVEEGSLVTPSPAAHLWLLIAVQPPAERREVRVSG